MRRPGGVGLDRGRPANGHRRRRRRRAADGHAHRRQRSGRGRGRRGPARAHSGPARRNGASGAATQRNCAYRHRRGSRPRPGRRADYPPAELQAKRMVVIAPLLMRACLRIVPLPASGATGEGSAAYGPRSHLAPRAVLERRGNGAAAPVRGSAREPDRHRPERSQSQPPWETRAGDLRPRDAGRGRSGLPAGRRPSSGSNRVPSEQSRVRDHRMDSRGRERVAGVVIDPAAFTHTSVAILDALNAFAGPTSRCTFPMCTGAKSSAIIPTSQASPRASSSAAEHRATHLRFSGSRSSSASGGEALRRESPAGGDGYALSVDIFAGKQHLC